MAQISDSKPGTPPPSVVDARRLIPENGKVTIVLDDQSYVLRITRAGKLILTK